MDSYQKSLLRLTAKAAELDAREKATLHLKVTKRLEAMYRCGKNVPACPHCGEGILLEDNLGLQQISKQMVLRKRAVIKQKLIRESEQ